MNGAPASAAATSLAKRLVFWDVARASWQYDLIVALILLFVFATPRAFFHDQPRAANVVLLANPHGGVQRFFLETDLLRHVAESERPAAAARLIERKTNKRYKISRVEPIRDGIEPDDWKGFIAYSTP